MRIELLGVRGSTPCPGDDFARVGGHTSCVAVAHDGRAPALVLDAGTGLRELPRLLHGEPFRGTLLLGHLHWDHTQGLPFCGAMDHPDARTRVLLPAQGTPALELFARAMSPPHFAVGPEDLRGDWTFDTMEEGVHELEGFTVLAAEIPHKGGRTFGFRIDDGNSSVAYLSDHAPHNLGAGPDGFGEYHAAALALADGVDVLIHDAQYRAAELTDRGSWGHAAADYCAALAERAGARRVLLYHHDPSRTDPEVEALANDVADAFPAIDVDVARQGMVIDLP